MAQRNAIATPANGLLVFQTDIAAGLYYNAGTAAKPSWQPISIPAGIATGDMLYWDGTKWGTVSGGSNGQALTFCNGVPTWGACPFPQLNTLAVADPAGGPASCAEDIHSDGGSTITTYGICWSTNQSPTISDAKTVKYTIQGQPFPVQDTGTFANTLFGLSANTKYYVRGYASNNNGTAYGNQVSFTSPIGFSIGQGYGGVLFFILIALANMA